MKIHRFFSELIRDRDAVSFANPDVTHQILHVLKLHVGEVVTVLDGKGMERDVELVQADKKHVTGVVIAERKNEAEPKRFVTLYAAILKREHFEWAVQKAVECGVSRIVPLITRRTIKKDVKRERLQEIAKEAAEQCGRGTVPVVEEPMTLEKGMEDAKQNDVNYFFDVSGVPMPPPPCFPPPQNEEGAGGGGDAGLFIGPEGGWDLDEIAAAKKTGLQPISLGPRVLRGETAAAIAVYLMTI